MFFFYDLGLALALVAALPYFLWKGRHGKYSRTFRERLGRLPAGLGARGGGSIWVHAVSVGEVLAVRPLLAALRGRFPGRPLYLSTTTETGQAVARRSVRDVDGLFYAPFDFRGPVRAVLDALRPELLLLVETELWPNLIHAAHRRGTRVAVVNGRISPRSFARYRRIRVLLRPVLAQVDLFLMQGEAHARRIVAMGAPPERVTVSGNLKFDSLEAPRVPELLARLLADDSRPLWVAGSTVAGEEELVLAAFRRVREHAPRATLLLAPRRPERFDEVPRLVAAAGFRCVRRSALASQPWRDGDVLLLDTLGELAHVYPLATAVFVGGSLVPAGGHNILEAAVAGKVAVVGPHMENFQEIADTFRAADALVQVASADELAPAVVGLLADAARRDALGARAQALVERERGALARTLAGLERLAPGGPSA